MICEKEMRQDRNEKDPDSFLHCNLSSEFNKVVDIALADFKGREKVEVLERRFGNLSATVISEADGTVEVRFTSDFNPHGERTEGRYSLRS